MADHPEQVLETISNFRKREMKDTLGLGGFSDYFEGLSMSWFLREQAELKDGEGFALFYGRDNDLFGKVEDLAYFSRKTETTADTIWSSPYVFGEQRGSGHRSVEKRISPLPDHDHDLEGNVDYNTFNANALAKGFETEIGLVKKCERTVYRGSG